MKRKIKKVNFDRLLGIILFVAALIFVILWGCFSVKLDQVYYLYSLTL